LEIVAMKIGCLGLDAAGAASARKVLAACGGLTVWDDDRAAVVALEKEGAQGATSLAHLISRCDVILLSLGGVAGMRELAAGKEGAPGGTAARKIVIDQSGTFPRDLAKRAERLAPLGIVTIDAVMLDPAEPTNEGTLLAAGPEGAFEKALPTLKILGANVVRCGQRPGDAVAVKLITRMMTAASALGTLEAVATGKKMGLRLQSLTDVLNKGSGRNYTTKSILTALVDGKAALSVPLAEMSADISGTIGLSVACKAPTPIGSVGRSLVQAASNTLGPSASFEDIAKVVASAAGTQLRDGESTASSPLEASENGTPVTIGYVGVGAMGAALARRLMQFYKVQVFDVRTELAQQLEKEGAKAATDLPTMARECDVIFLCVPSSIEVRQVLFGSQGLVEGLSAGKIVVDQTTSDPIETRTVAAELSELGISLVDAPVSGGPETAPAGTSTLICSGSTDAYGKVLPILKSISPNIFFCGPSGNGHVVKLVNNASNICNRLIAYEAALLGFKYGLALPVLDEVVNKSTAWSFASQRMFKAVATHAQTAVITLELSLKDIWSAVEMGIGCGAPMTIGDTARSLFQMGVNRFGGQANVDEMARLFEEMGHIDFANP
jgi:3-hydroxyisobutyrate dehydrogenase